MVPISVIMPYHNCERYISNAVESILHQSFANFEFIIINDGSTDNSSLIVKKNNDKRINHIQFNKNRGNYCARNAGMKNAKGKYICVMDADDIATGDRLKHQYDFMENHPKIGLIGSQGEYINENNIPTGAKLFKPVCSTAKLKTFLLFNNFTLHPSLMFRAHLLHKHNLFYNENYKVAADYDFVVRWAKYSSIRNIDRILLQYRIHSTQISSKDWQLQNFYANKIRVRQLKKFFARPSPATIELYLKLMNRCKLDKMEIYQAAALIDKIIDRNRAFKLYNHNYLNELYNYLLFETNIIALESI